MEDKKYMDGQIKPFAAFVTNLGKYNKGDLEGTWLEFPTTYEKSQEALKRIGVGKETGYEEYFITDYDCNVENLHEFLGEHETIEELNYLAMKLDEMNKGQLEKFEQVVKVADNTSSVEDLINLTENLDKYTYYPNVTSDEDLGRFCVKELGSLNIPEEIEPYFDYEDYGRDTAINEGGTFVDKGYVSGLHADVVKEYDREKGIPDEYSLKKTDTEQSVNQNKNMMKMQMMGRGR